MDLRRVLQIAIVLWAAVGATLAFASLGEVNDDARVLVGIASFVGPLAAVASAYVLARSADRVAGVLLLVSVCTPTYFAYPLNVLAIVVGLVLLAVPHALRHDRRGLGST